MEPDGAVRDECRSRVFESALMLRLLRLESAYPEVQARTVVYLEDMRRKDGLDPFDAALIDGVLTTAQKPEGIEHYFSTCQHFATRRKRMMFGAVLALTNGTRFDAEFQEADFAPKEQYQSWVRVEVLALKILYAVSLGRLGWIKDEDVAVIAEALAQSPSREHMMPRQILALLALRSIPGQERTIRRGIERLVVLQRRDGGFPYISGMEIFSTAVAGLALTGAGSDSNRSTLVQMAEYLASHQQTDGGWAYAEGVRQTDVDDTSYCLEFLSSIGAHRYAEPCARATTYLLAMQARDGGFPTFARGADPEIAMTAAVIMALAAAAEVPAEVLYRGASYVLERQKADGTFERSWSLSETNAIYRAMVAMRRLRCHPSSDLARKIEAAAESSRGYLVRSQNEDGGWGQVRGTPSDVISTSYALSALSHIGDNATLERGLSYLLSRQQAHGGFVSVPDQAGPRPIPYDIPILADIFALLAMNHALMSRTVSSRPRGVLQVCAPSVVVE
ncbi:prenyltransferase/squalene oxidase repeat-containing protein [Sorangium sp. So ce1128]